MLLLPLRQQVLRLRFLLVFLPRQKLLQLRILPHSFLLPLLEMLPVETDCVQLQNSTPQPLVDLPTLLLALPPGRILPSTLQGKTLLLQALLLPEPVVGSSLAGSLTASSVVSLYGWGFCFMQVRRLRFFRVFLKVFYSCLNGVFWLLRTC